MHGGRQASGSRSILKSYIVQLLGNKRAKRLKAIFEYIACFVTSQPLILVYQMGKVGSQSIYYSLLNAGVFPVFFLHTIDLLRDSENLQYRYLSYALKKNKPIKIITLTREPISRTISSFAHDFHGYFGLTMEDYSLEDLESFFWRYDRHNWVLEWFDFEFRTITGIDVYQYTFDKEEGYKTINKANIDVLIMKLETPDCVKEEAVRVFLNQPTFTIERYNSASKQTYNNKYNDFRSNIELPSSYIDEMYNSKFCSHFYSAHEVSQFVHKWAR